MPCALTAAAVRASISRAALSVSYLKRQQFVGIKTCQICLELALEVVLSLIWLRTLWCPSGCSKNAQHKTRSAQGAASKRSTFALKQ